MATFDRNNLPRDTPLEWVDAVNDGIERLRARKIAKIKFERPTHLAFCARWIEIYLQTHIRRGLSLIDGGLSELKVGRTLIAAFCARALLEDAALLWSFNRRVDALLEEGNIDEVDSYVFSKALASRLPRHIARWGDEYKATNIITAIEKMTVEHPNVRPMYEELSDVCHPNTHGVLWHFSELDGKGAITFDDGANKSDAALGSLIFCSILFVGEEPAISKLEAKLRKLS